MTPIPYSHKIACRYVLFKCPFDNSAHNEKFHQGTWGVFVAPSDLILAGKRCLVLDDEFLIALDIQEILEAAGVAQVVCVG